ncbi:MAG: type II toxin-antitoxin system RelE/ParE family toxin [Thermodesulfobacteriota bacterium]
MDYHVVWSPQASADVEAIAEFIARDSVAYAKAAATGVLKATRHLKQFPFLGRTVPEIGKESIRGCFAYGYRIIYRISERKITISAVVHGKRLPDSFKTDIEET